ncbi:TetR/AcrR family transcriptional regulator [Acetobacteraceae bacterium KSS8]|uniref:TetR/AcrR family transcriptional regulator n=1 Tax=Endosaccharibacter trunci TaxID=2812733 RepID=A0ABT1W436_9PROT|nr:TetR/AcrR family transcriptional regulator [Acetobacteraceae bacterium KSS8]
MTARDSVADYKAPAWHVGERSAYLIRQDDDSRQRVYYDDTHNQRRYPVDSCVGRNTVKVSKLQASDNRQVMLKAAAEQMRGQGLTQMSVAEVAKAAGLTHGALYSHFGSREALQVQAMGQAFSDCADLFTGKTAKEFLQTYLSLEHRDHAEQGCPTSAFVSEMRLQSEPSRIAFWEGLQRSLALTAASLGLGAAPNQQSRAIFALSAMAGGMAISRAIRDIDETASANVLQAVDKQLRELVLSWSGRAQHKVGAKPKRLRSEKPPGSTSSAASPRARRRRPTS